jgi:hypothetical protein
MNQKRNAKEKNTKGRNKRVTKKGAGAKEMRDKGEFLPSRLDLNSTFLLWCPTDPSIQRLFVEFVPVCYSSRTLLCVSHLLHEKIK